MTLNDENTVNCIRKLPNDVIEKIAAGEVILHPAGALKELLENSIDAQSTEITINISHGGFEYLKISDNGIGMCKEDLMIACKRFTSSKNPGSLIGIKTFGFRGEGLAALSQSSLVTITSRTNTSPIGYKIKYMNGDPIDIQEIECEIGTIVEYENLFYNNQVRLKSLIKQGNVHYFKCMDLVQHYAIHFTNISFSMYKYSTKNDGHSVLSFQTFGKSSDSDLHFDVIRNLYGEKISNHLIQFTSSLDDDVNYQCDGFIANTTNLSCNTTITFVNNRLVELPNLCKIIDNIYLNTMGTGRSKFVYLSIKIPLQQVDVNIHPTKKHVSFINQEEVEYHIGKVFQQLLENSVHVVDNSIINHVKAGKLFSSDNKVIPTRSRTDFHQSSIKTFLSLNQLNEVNSQFVKQSSSLHLDEFTYKPEANKSQLMESETIDKMDVIYLIKKSVFVGTVDEKWIILQYGKKLILIDIREVIRRYIYNYLIKEHAGYRRVAFEPKLMISELVKINDKLSTFTENVDSQYVNLLESVGIGIEVIEGVTYLVTFPHIIDNHYPNVPILAKCVGALLSDNRKNINPNAKEISKIISESLSVIPEGASTSEYLEHIFYNGLKRSNRYFDLNVSGEFVIELASLDKIYKLFERC